MSSLSAAKQSALEEAEIRSLLLRERHYKDNFLWEKLRTCYHPDPAKTYINVSWSVSVVHFPSLHITCSLSTNRLVGSQATSTASSLARKR
jgi:hypothetical protein